MFILIGPHVRHFSDGNQTVCPTLKKKTWPPIMPKQRERCLDVRHYFKKLPKFHTLQSFNKFYLTIKLFQLF
jgi:hypothetical protein